MTESLVLSPALMLLAAVGLCDVAQAQVFQGAVLEDSSRLVIRRYPVALVRFLPRGEAVVARTKTDDRGLFQLIADRPGIFQIEFGDSLTGITYGPVDTVSVDTLVVRQYVVRPAADLPRRVFLEYHVDEPVTQISSSVRYPVELRERGICGRVLAQFVVDTLGNAQMATFRILRSTDSLFSRAVREGINRSRFKPARFRDRAVLQLVQQPFEFTVTTGRVVYAPGYPKRDTFPPEPELPHHSCWSHKLDR